MPIALSLPLAPSRLLLRLRLGFAALCVAMALAGAAGWLGPLRWPAACVIASAAAGAAVAAATRRPVNAHRLDVLGPGALVLTVQQEMALPRRMPVRLLAGSTLWPGLLVLRLADGEAPPLALLLCADSLPPGQFRRLAMAVRALAARQTDEAGIYYKNR